MTLPSTHQPTVHTLITLSVETMCTHYSAIPLRFCSEQTESQRSLARLERDSKSIAIQMMLDNYRLEEVKLNALVSIGSVIAVCSESPCTGGRVAAYKAPSLTGSSTEPPSLCGPAFY